MEKVIKKINGGDFMRIVMTFYIGYIQGRELSREAKLRELSIKLLNKVFYVTDKKGEIKKSYQVTEILIKKDKLKVKFCEKIVSQKGIVCKNRVKFQDLAVLEKKLGRALY